MPTSAMTPESLALHQLVEARLPEFRTLLDKYAATNPRLFGSVARGTAQVGSDIDILVEMDPADGNLLMRASGLMEERPGRCLAVMTSMCSRSSFSSIRSLRQLWKKRWRYES